MNKGVYGMPLFKKGETQIYMHLLVFLMKGY